MSKIIEANGLQLIPIRSELSAVEDLSELHSTISEHFGAASPALFVAYLDNQVVIGKYQEQKDSIEAKYLQRLRVFTPQAELLVWQSHGSLQGRFRRDYKKESEEGEACEVVEASQVLFGTDARPLENGKTEIFEKRGTRMILPFSDILVNDKEQRVRLKTRNYIGYNDVQQASYVDCRFVDFIFAQQDASEDD